MSALAGGSTPPLPPTPKTKTKGLPTLDKLTGELQQHRIVGESFWSIATLKTSEGTVSMTGKLLGAHVGDSIEVEGDWDRHPKYGKQFKVRTCRVVVPQTDNGVIAWLSMRLPNVGKGRAVALLAHFGGATKLWAALEKDPARLAEVSGITPDRVEAIASAYKNFREERDRMIRFRSWGMTENQVAKMLAAWGDDAETRLRKDPYELAEVVAGFGFLRADAIAQRMGIPLDNVGRVECGLRYTMAEATGAGHCYVSTGKLVAIAAQKVLRIDGDIVAKHLGIMKGRGEFVQHGKRTYTRHLNHHEQRCADRIRALLRQRDAQGIE